MILITQLMHEIKNLHFLPKVGLLILSCYSLSVFGYSIYGAVTGISDVDSFFITSKLLINKIDPYKLSVDYIKSVPEINFQGLCGAGGSSLYPPSTHILFIPFYVFLASPQLAKISWLLWNLVFIGIIFYSIREKFLSRSPVLHSYLFLLLIIGSYATKSCLRYGQTSLFSFAAFMVTLLLKDRSKWLAGVAFALAFSKPTLMALFAVYFLCKKEYQIVMVALTVHVLITLGLSAWIGAPPLSLINNYLEKVSLLTNTYPCALWWVYQVTGFSIISLLHLFQFPTEGITIIRLLLYVGAAIYLYRERQDEEIRALGLIGLISMFIDYHWHYDFVVLFLLFPVFIKPLPGNDRNQWPLFYYLVLIYMPDLMRTGDFLRTHSYYLIAWHSIYTGMFLILLWIFMKRSAPRAGNAVTFRSHQLT